MFLLSRLLAKKPQILATFLIFSLSAGIVGGILFYMENTRPKVLSDLTQNLDVDMEIAITSAFYEQNTTRIEDIEALLASSYVDEVEPLSVLDTYVTLEYDEGGYYYYSRAVYLGVEDSFFDTFPSVVDFESNVPPLSNDTCYLEIGFFNKWGYSIGDYYNATVTTYDEYWNEIQVNASYLIVGTFKSNIFENEYYYYYEEYSDSDTSLVMITTKDAINTDFSSIGYGQSFAISEQYWVSINENSVIDQNDENMFDSLDSIRRQFEQNALPYAIVTSFELRDAIRQYQAWYLSMTMLAFAFSIPTIVMGILLVYYNSTLHTDEIRRDIGTIKTRGASGWQAFNWIVGSAVVTGLIGSLGALLVGWASALLSTTVKLLLVFDFTRLSGLAIIASLPSLAAVFVFAFGVGLLTALPMAVRSFLMTATEAHSVVERDVLLSKENLGNVMVDVVALGIAGYILVPILTLISYVSYFREMQVFLLMMLIPMMAIFVLSFSRLLARPTATIKASILGKIGMRTARVGAKVMSRTLLSYKKSEALGVIFIALVFTVSVMSGISAETASVHTESVYKFYTGADISITVKEGLTNVTLDFLDNITAVEGVASVTPVFKIYQYVSFYTSYYYSRDFVNQSMLIYGVDPSTWLESAFWLSYFTLENEPSLAVSKMLEDENNVLASFRPVDHYQGEGYSRTPVYGEDISISFRTKKWANVTNMKIVDVMARSPDFWDNQKYLQGEPDTSYFVVANIDFVHKYLNTSSVNKFLVSIEPTADYRSVMNRLHNLTQYSFSAIESPYTGIEQAQESKASQSIYGVYTLNVLFTIIYLSIGAIIVASVRISSLRRNFSILRALGTETKEIKRIVLVDTAMSVMISLGIGTLLGGLLAVYSINMPLIYIGTDTLAMWTRLPVMLNAPWFVLGIIFLISFVFALGATFVVAGKALKRNIAEEIQYAE